LGARLVALAERLHTAGVQIAFDPNYRNLMGADYPALFERMAGLAHILKLSEEDIARIYPGRGIEESLAHLRMLSPEVLIIYTRGERGMVAQTANERIEQAVIPAAGGDSVGAGDGCMGAFVASRLARPAARLAEHLRFTAAAAAVICNHTGAYAPSRAEVDALLADAG
jgi:fructokinase